MKIFNTLSGQKEEFSPRDNEVKMYVCGVTPYSDAHLGHAMSYIIFDVVRRYLRFRGFKVKYVQNVTDIDDKIIDRANKLGITTRDLSGKFITSFKADMNALNIEPPDAAPYATETIPEMIEVIRGLVDKGYAYPAGGSVYFRVRNVPDYGKLSHRNLESMMAGARIEVGEEKEHPMDFVLWKASKPGEPNWESPWGPGRPGWHIECSAMSLKYLGNAIDIHGGGQDLIFPHHENEIAQSESYTGVKPFVKYWMHNGLVQLGEEKMSKSLGNLVTIKQALEKYGADAIRIFVLSSHYRSPLTYSEEIMEAAERGAERLRQAARSRFREKGNTEETDPEPYQQKFIEAMDDDFNTAQALATLFDLAREINRADEAGNNVYEARETLRELVGVLGLTLEEKKYHFDTQIVGNLAAAWAIAKSAISQGINDPDISNAILEVDNITKFMEEKIKTLSVELGKNVEEEQLALHDAVVANIQAQADLRNKLRQAKQFQLADEIRAKLDEMGIVLEDTPQGTVWKRKK